MRIKKETSLEMQSQDTKETLNWKLEQLTNNNLPVEQGMADYIYFGVSNIDAKIKQLKAYKDEILKEVKNLKTYKSTVSKEIAEWIQEQGIDKLNGLECSSITINNGNKETEENIITKKFITHLTQDEIYNVINEQGLGHWVVNQEVKVSLATKDTIRINSKRK